MLELVGAPAGEVVGVDGDESIVEADGAMVEGDDGVMVDGDEIVDPVPAGETVAPGEVVHGAEVLVVVPTAPLDTPVDVTPVDVVPVVPQG